MSATGGEASRGEGGPSEVGKHVDADSDSKCIVNSSQRRVPRL